MKKVDFIFFDAGGGHRAAATALKTVLEEQNRPWRVRLINLQELLSPLDIFRKYLGIRMEDVYNKLLAKGWTLGSGLLVPPMHAIIKLHHRGQRRLLRQFWEADPPDLVVSVVPNFNRALFQALQLVNPRIPMVTILTDLADYPPHFWIEKQPQHFICGSDRAVQQALEMGHSRDRVHHVSGMILRPVFYRKIELDRASEREKLGLRPDLPTAVVLFGGQGSSVMVKIAERLNAANLPVQLIFICGKNEKLANRLKSMQHRIPVHVVGFTQEVPHYMHLSDFMIGKPGPGSISEALAMHLPVILERNAWTLPQERFNTEWVREKQVGIVVNNFSEIVPAVERMIAPETLRQFRSNAASIENRAIFEIPEILEHIMNKESPQ